MCGAERVFGLVNGVRDELPGMLILQSVIDLGALLTGGDHPRQPHLGKMLGDAGRGFAGYFGERVDRKFPFTQGENQPHPGGVGQHGKDLHRKFHIFAACRQLASITICIHTQIVALAGKERQAQVPQKVR